MTKGNTYSVFFTVYIVCIFQCPKFDFPRLCLKMGVWTPLSNGQIQVLIVQRQDSSRAPPLFGSFSFCQIKISYTTKKSNVACIFSGPPHCLRVHQHLFVPRSTDNIISVFFPNSQPLLCLAIVSCLSKWYRNSNLRCIMRHRNSSLAFSITFIMLYQHCP